MSVKVFFPKIPDNEDEFKKFVNRHCEGRCRFAKNKDNSKICILSIKYDENIHCANDFIRRVSGQILNDIVLKPKINVDNQTLRGLDGVNFPASEGIEDVVTTTHVEDDKFYVQLLSETEDKSYLVNKLNELYQDFTVKNLVSLTMKDISVGNMYATTFQNDGCFHRIQILDKIGDKLHVSFVDYGNTEDIEVDRIIGIDDDMKSRLPLVHCCQIEGVRIVDKERHQHLSMEVLNRRSKARIVWQMSSVYSVRRVVYIDYLEFTTISYRDYLVGSGIAILNGSTPKTSLSPRINKNEPVSLNNLNGLKEKKRTAIMTHYESLTEFYVLIEDPETDRKMAAINYLISKLPDKYDSQLNFYNRDIVYLSKYNEDGNLYRCRIIEEGPDTHNKGALVQFIDFGNSEWKADKSELRMLSDVWCLDAATLGDFPPCSVRCSFEEDVVYTLQCAGVGKRYFLDTFLNPELQLTLYFTYNSDNELLVSNIEFGNCEDLLTEFEKTLETENSDKYALTCLDSLDRIWFVLIKSHNRTVQNKIDIIHKLCTSDLQLEPIDSPIIENIYLAITETEKKLRGRYIGSDRRGVKMFFRDIDTGFIEIIKYDQVYHLPSNAIEFEGFARPYKFKVKSNGNSEIELLRNIKRIIGKSDVSLRLQNDEESIVDVVVKGKSLVKYLAKLGFVDTRESQLPDLLEESLKEIPDCQVSKMIQKQQESLCTQLLVNNKEDSTDVDFTLPSVEDMVQIPIDIIGANARVRFLRTLFPIGVSLEESVLIQELSGLQSLSLDSNELVELSCSVCQLGQELSDLQDRFSDRCCNARVKRGDMQDLVEERTIICQRIVELHTTFSKLMQRDSLDQEVDSLSSKIQRVMLYLANMRRAAGCEDLEVDANTVTPESSITFEEVVSQLAAALSLEGVRTAAASSEPLRKETENAGRDLIQIVDSMCCQYEPAHDLTVDLPDTAPLIDTTYMLHAALNQELKHYIAAHKAQPLLLELVTRGHGCLTRYFCHLQTILTQFRQLQGLHATTISMASDTISDQIVARIEANNKTLLHHRSALRRAIADLEDAEDCEDLTKIEMRTTEVDSVRVQLHQALQTSADILDEPDTTALLLLRPELQVLNQTILLPNEHKAPVFLWDAKYFRQDAVNYQQNGNMRNSNESTTESSSIRQRLYLSQLGDQPISILQLRLPQTVPEFNIKSFLTNFCVVQTIDRPLCTHTIRVVLLPVRHCFLSSSNPNSMYAVLPRHRCANSELIQLCTDVVSLLQLIRSALSVAVNLWHTGYIYSEADLADGLFLRLLDKDDDDTLYLPLPITAINTREIIMGPENTNNSIHIFMSAIHRVIFLASSHCVDLIKESNEESLTALVNLVGECKHIDDAESLINDISAHLDRIVNLNQSIRIIEPDPTVETEKDDSGAVLREEENDNSIEKVKEDDGIDEEVDSVKDQFEEDALLEVEPEKPIITKEDKSAVADEKMKVDVSTTLAEVEPNSKSDESSNEFDNVEVVELELTSEDEKTVAGAINSVSKRSEVVLEEVSSLE